MFPYDMDGEKNSTESGVAVSKNGSNRMSGEVISKSVGMNTDCGAYFLTRDGKDYRVMTNAQLEEEIKYVEEVLDFYRSLNGDVDPILRGIIQGDLTCLNAEKA